MRTELVFALLAIGFVGSIAAFFVMWSFYDGQKKLTQEEREKRWSEISRSVGLENEIELSKAVIANQQTELKAMEFRIGQIRLRNRNLQDRLSEAICPHNDHVWKDGRCVKCGRVKE